MSQALHRPLHSKRMLLAPPLPSGSPRTPGQHGTRLRVFGLGPMHLVTARTKAPTYRKRDCGSGCKLSSFGLKIGVRTCRLLLHAPSLGAVTIQQGFVPVRGYWMRSVVVPTPQNPKPLNPTIYDYTPLRTIIKILFLIFSWALYEQK